MALKKCATCPLAVASISTALIHTYVLKGFLENFDSEA
jgi:hypothetical protein